MKKFLISLGLILIISIKNVYANPFYMYETYTKVESTYNTSGYDNFDDTISYSDGSGYSGYYYKDGSSYVISGEKSEAKWVTKTVEYDNSNYPSEYYYSDGEYSGSIGVSNVSNASRTKSVSGSASICEALNQRCIQGGSRQRNSNYNDKIFNYYDIGTWKYWEVGSVWTSQFSKAFGAESCSSNFSVSWNDSTPYRATYDDGEFSGEVNVSSNGVDTESYEVYKLNPNNSYTPPYTGQECQTGLNTYHYSLSGQVTATSYRVTYQGYIYTPDTRIWRQDYKGTMSKVITHELNADISTDMPEKMIEGNTYKVNITAINTGDIIWNEDTKIRLGKKKGNFPFPDRLYLPKGLTVKYGEKYTWSIDVTAPQKNPKEYDIELKMIKDNESNGWFGNDLDKNILVYDFVPYNGTLEVRKYDYYDSSNNSYWVKPNSLVQIYSDSFFNSKTELYPSKNYINLGKTVLTSSISGSKGSGEQFRYFTLENNKAKQVQENNKNLLKSIQDFKINTQDSEYKILYKSEYVKDNAKYNTEYKDSNKWLKIDGTAPKGDVVIDEPTLGEIQVNVKNIIEKGSGLEKVWIEYSANGKTIKQELGNDVNKQYDDRKKIKDMFAGEIEFVNVVVKATDKVGNIGILHSEKVYMFSVKAKIQRVLKPHRPYFKQGEKGIIHIDLKGGVEKIKITFPRELTQFDKKLNKEIVLSGKSKERIDYEFYVPINTPEKSYNVEINAYKKGKQKNVYPDFEVKGNILDELRTRIKRGR